MSRRRLLLEGTRRNARTLAACAAIATAAVAMGVGWQVSSAAAKPPKGKGAAQRDASALAPTTAPAVSAGPDAGTSGTPTTTRIEFSTVPAVHATVSWGKTVLGHIAPHKPLVVVRPRDSGPLDVSVYARGFLPVHTRAQTFEDSKVAVKLTRVDEKATLFGYREPLDAGPPDGGAAAFMPGPAPQPPPAGPTNPQPQSPAPSPSGQR